MKQVFVLLLVLLGGCLSGSPVPSEPPIGTLTSCVTVGPSSGFRCENTAGIWGCGQAHDHNGCTWLGPLPAGHPLIPKHPSSGINLLPDTPLDTDWLPPETRLANTRLWCTSYELCRSQPALSHYAFCTLNQIQPRLEPVALPAERPPT